MYISYLLHIKRDKSYSTVQYKSNYSMFSLDVPSELIVEHRLYDTEVLEFSPTVTFIVLLPPHNQLCCTHYQSEDTNSNKVLTTPNSADNLIAVPVKPFEISHIHTYNREFLSAYTKAMILVDMELTAAHQRQREVV